MVQSERFKRVYSRPYLTVSENKSIALDDRTFKNYYIFGEYKRLPDSHPLKMYLKYFATNAAESTETQEIHTKVEWYRTDGLTQERYMTWEQEIQIAAADAAEKAAKVATEKERERNKKIIAEKDREIARVLARNAELEAKLAEKSK